MIVTRLRGPVRDVVDTDSGLRQRPKIECFLPGMKQFLRGAQQQRQLGVGMRGADVFTPTTSPRSLATT
jgi:hypothetical protein